MGVASSSENYTTYQIGKFSLLNTPVPAFRDTMVVRRLHKSRNEVGCTYTRLESCRVTSRHVTILGKERTWYWEGYKVVNLLSSTLVDFCESICFILLLFYFLSTFLIRFCFQRYFSHCKNHQTFSKRMYAVHFIFLPFILFTVIYFLLLVILFSIFIFLIFLYTYFFI